MRHFKGTLGVACLLFTQKQPEHDEECSGCLLAWGFAKVSARVETALKNNGFLPNLIGVLANAPAALAMYQEVGALNAATSLTAGEREVVQITAAVLNECGFCKAGHTALSTKKNLLDPQAIEALRNTQALEDPKLNRLALFTQAVMANKGNVGDAELQAFFDTGYNEQQALELWKWCWAWRWPLCVTMPIIWLTRKSTSNCSLLPDQTVGLEEAV